MPKSYDSILSCIGNTPLVKLNKYCEYTHIQKNIYVKLESANPGGSIKIRAALACIEKAEKSGKLNEEYDLIIEAANFNTAIGLAIVCCAKNYKLVVVMPDIEDNEKYSMLHAYGVQVVLTPGEQGMEGAIKKAAELTKKHHYAYRPNIFKNIASVSAYRNIANEIWRDTNGNADIIVCGVGSGATITGIGESIKRKKKNVEMVAVEAAEAQVLLNSDPPSSSSPHGMRGISYCTTPPLVNSKIIDEVYPVSSSNAYGACVALASTDGILAGISSGAVIHAATQLARMPENADKTIVAILPDTGEHYLGTGLFDWNESYILID